MGKEKEVIKDGLLLTLLMLGCGGIGWQYARIEALEAHRIEITAAADAVARAGEMCRVHFASL